MFLIDAHNDTAYRMYFEKQPLDTNNLQIDLQKQKSFRTLLLFAIFMDPEKLQEFSTPLDYFSAIYENFSKELRKNSQILQFTRSSKDFLLSNTNQAMLTLEGGSLIDSLELVDYLLEKQFKVITLTWNDSNRLATSAASGDSGGLSSFGCEVLRKMNDSKMVADLSHASDKTFWDVLQKTTRPVLVSHSNSRALCNHPRNITDDMFRALMENKGVLGINFYPPFLGEEASLETIFSHMEHFLMLGGENHVGFGSDFDGVDCLPYGITDFSSYEAILSEMKRRGYSQSLMEKIFYKNMMRVLE
ncbi:MAG: dipeptidase [Clostridia bacterium]|nr:dipeptidase [Clostridia bacterium]